MPRLMFLVSSARVLPLDDGTTYETGTFAEEALTPYERFVEAGLDFDVVTPDGNPPNIDPYGLEPIFHYPDEDEDFLGTITRTFAHDIDDIRLTLRHITELGLIGARRIFQALRGKGLSPVEARELISKAAKDSWERDRQFADTLTGPACPLTRAEIGQRIGEVIAESEAESARVARTLAEIPGFRHPLNLGEMSDEQMASYDAVFAPGGHGPMVDLADNPDVRRLLAILHEASAPIASLCHGPAMLLSAGAKVDGTWLFDGYRVTAITNEEEYQTEPSARPVADGAERPTGQVQWQIESALRNAGAVFDDARAPWTSHVVVDRNLITGQNPNSSEAVADAVLKSLNLL
ncbi:type 1 glutamine amidotransferase domain-containing protein [Amycolatopsis sp. GM8]|uniref:type 1 glutamine amidotransferase domain-containing protein n=1 Tax=Amycolatopsis sp. GM8 TaxID=2896530 RepID=UPI001F1F5A28|nr:type 1 glutamine amidotransferase domain-containing protein [Amycolatopsis sp. GM8]